MDDFFISMYAMVQLESVVCVSLSEMYHSQRVLNHIYETNGVAGDTIIMQTAANFQSCVLYRFKIQAASERMLSSR